ncbi:MAG: hypothetical protein IJ335_00425 [Lachnospiraceae bacterium]|nr:hypothetical protein [Lachnospiraceae bacterium]
MQTLNYWEQFEKSGRIEDYLNYTSQREAQQQGTHCEQTGEHPYAGICERNRNHTETDAYR